MTGRTGEGGEPAPDLSVVVPAFNEAQRLGATLERIADYLEARSLSFEILVADDGSADDTSGVAERFGDRGVRVLRDPQNRGKGAALRRGVLASRGARVLLTDADLSTPIEDLERLELHLGAAAAVLGSRSVPGAELVVPQPYYRQMMGRTFNFLLRCTGLITQMDTQCGFKLLDGEVARETFSLLVTPGFAYDVELVWLLERRGYRVAEIGVRWADSTASKVRPWLDPLEMLLEIARFRWHHRRLPAAGVRERPPGGDVGGA